MHSYVLVSAVNASTTSPIFYSKMKGQLEADVKALKFSRLIIFNPPLLLRANSNRKMEVIGATVISLVNKLGLWGSQKPMPTKLLATAMLNAIKVLKDGAHAIIAQHILDFV
jgi:hypothetical protein